ncbi:glucokinase [Oricola sp.]|uniref:glucokinase n=1 Tax=Oricola sp. TaxID=1979950 RepID=UPI0025D340E5|nr:glucokinase [Oricola sp.]MCI5076464.1 glucokinase [Oricola sp.]
MPASKRSAIIGDIGGTHARFAICDIDKLSVKHFAVFETKMFTSLPEAVAHYLEAIPDRPHIAGFSVADPLTGDRIGIENASWRFTSEEVRGACGVEKIHFVNNFEALALCLPFLNAHDRCRINGGEPVDGAPMIVLGTGGEFGSAMLIGPSGRQTPIAGSAGHMAFSATNEREMAILAKVAGEYGYAPIQSVLSGRGLETVHSVLSELEGLPEPSLHAREIIDLALKDDDALARDTLDCFVSIMARVAGDLALLHDARGGVFLGRGITPKIVPLLDSDRFRELFANKGAKSDALASIPVHAILANDAGLRGAAIATSERFPMDGAV